MDVDPEVRNAASALEILAASAASATPVLSVPVIDVDNEDSDDDMELEVVPVPVAVAAAIPCPPTPAASSLTELESVSTPEQEPTVELVEVSAVISPTTTEEETSRAASIPLPASPILAAISGLPESVPLPEDEEDEPLMGNVF